MWIDGVRAALRECLEVGKGDVVLVLSDEENRNIGEAFFREAKKLAKAFLVLHEDFGPRPTKVYPQSLHTYIEKIRPTVSIYVAVPRAQEFPFRKKLIEHLTSLGARHAHMPGVTEEIIDVGLRECGKVVEVTERVASVLKPSKEIFVTSPAGTELHIKVGKYAWGVDTGKLRKGEWGNLPAGEVFTAPEDVEGVAVVDGCLGDYFKKYGRLKHPLRIVIEGGEAVEVSSQDSGLAEEFWRYISEKENGVRVGEIGVGTNINIPEPIGNLLLDEKYPSVHLALGDPLGDITGAPWRSEVHVDGVMLRTSIRVDGRWLMREGRFLI